VLTSHEAVDGLPRLVLSTAGDRRRVVAAADVTPLPELGLALVRTEGLGVDPLPLTARDRVEAGTYVRIAAGGWREARVLGTTDVTYTATDRFHLLGDALELAVGTCGRDALRLGGGAAGGPVLDVATGAVLGVLGTALSSGHSDVGFAVPLRRATAGPLAGLLAENAATVPAYGADLNLAGVLALTATSVTDGGPTAAPGGGTGAGEPVERAAVTREFAAFTAGRARVLGLVGAPGSGRTTELAALAARRSRGPDAAPTLWLRGADLHDDDMSLADAARRTLTRAARIVAASGRPGPGDLGDLGDIAPERLARLARAAGRPLLVLLDGPEEMPPVLAHRLPEWTEGTATWLRETDTRLVVACRAEYWEHAGAEFPGELLYAPGAGVPLPASVGVGAGAMREAAASAPWPGPGGAVRAAGGVPPSGAALALPGPVPGAGSSAAGGVHWPGTGLREPRSGAAEGAPASRAFGGASGAAPWPRGTDGTVGPRPGWAAAGPSGVMDAAGPEPASPELVSAGSRGSLREPRSGAAEGAPAPRASGGASGAEPWPRRTDGTVGPRPGWAAAGPSGGTDAAGPGPPRAGGGRHPDRRHLDRCHPGRWPQASGGAGSTGSRPVFAWET
jgi:hypothetical protein